MEFRLSDDQFELQDAVRRFCVDTVRSEVSPSEWRARRPLVVACPRRSRGLRASGSCGKRRLRARLVEATVVFEQLGAHLVAGPVVWSTITAPLVTGTVDGSRVVAGLELDLRSGDPLVVEHGTEADTVVVLHQGGAFAHERDELPDPVAARSALTP